MEEEWQKIKDSSKVLSAKTRAENELKKINFEKKEKIQTSLEEKKSYKNLAYLELNNLNSMDYKLQKKFKSGQLQIDSTLDLHGYKIEEGQKTLINFIQNAHANNLRNLLVITGRSFRSKTPENTLKSNFIKWLNMQEIREMILAATQAQPKFGGEGAFLIMLKRKL